MLPETELPTQPLFAPESIPQATDVGASFGSGIVWIIFALAIIGFIIYTGILFYHWFKYVSYSPMVWPVSILYLSVSGFLVFEVGLEVEFLINFLGREKRSLVNSKGVVHVKLILCETP